jgi:hypothetical protein
MERLFSASTQTRKMERMEMKKLMTVALFLIVALGFAGNSLALQFTLDSYNVNLRTSDPGLVLYWSPILSTPAR